jgi:transcriptional regulator with XRE-family HTH domain
MFSMTESDLRAILGANIKRYRGFKGLSQAKLAEMLDISPNFISDLETGKRWLSSDTLVNLADVLNVEVHEFLKPDHAPGDTISTFIQNYNTKVSSSVTEAVNRSLESLRRQYDTK